MQEVSELRKRATTSAAQSVFGGICVQPMEHVQVQLQETFEDGTLFYFIQCGEGGGWLKAKYIAAAVF